VFANQKAMDAAKLYDIITSYREVVCVCDDQAFEGPYLLAFFFHATVSLVQILYLCFRPCVLAFISTVYPAVLDSRKLLFLPDPLNTTDTLMIYVDRHLTGHVTHIMDTLKHANLTLPH